LNTYIPCRCRPNSDDWLFCCIAASDSELKRI
jgi:hypothetical protein